jgi:hypothetical protein
MDMGAPCVLPRERASRPGDERYSANPPSTADFVLAAAKKDGHQGAREKELDRRGYAPAPVPTAQPMAGEELATAWPREAKDVFEVRT